MWRMVIMLFAAMLSVALPVNMRAFIYVGACVRVHVRTAVRDIVLCAVVLSDPGVSVIGLARIG